MLNGVAVMEFDSNQMQALAVTWVHTFSPTFFHELIGSFKRNEWFGGEVENTNWPDKFCLPNPVQTTRRPQIGRLSIGNYGYLNNHQKKNHEKYFNLERNFTKIQGKHELLVRL